MKGKIWLGTFNGLYVIDEKKNEVISLKEDLMRSFSLSDKMIYSMCQDSEGGIWIGTLFGGVNYLPNRNLQFDKFVPGRLRKFTQYQTYPGTGRRCERQYLDRYGGCGNQCTECGEWGNKADKG